jgi:hypothetical protein
MRLRTRALFATAALLATVAPLSSGAAAADGDPRQVGQFSAPFEETGGKCVDDADGRLLCKPAGTAVSSLVTGRVLYWDALEGTENVNLNALLEGGTKTRDDRTRVLDLTGSSARFRTPSPEDAGAYPDGNGGEYLPLTPYDDPIVNDGDLFCADFEQLVDGRILAVGGTDYYAEPYVGELAGTKYGLIELEGIKAARIFDPFTETWSQSGSMEYGRWYPSLITLPSGQLLALSGVTKLVKPLYADRPFDSGTNVRQLEAYDPSSGTWTTASPTANRSLPLYPRVHLLPNGHVYYDAGGQVFNPMGQSYDEAFWNIAATYDPVAQRWTDLGVPGLGLGALPGLPDLPGANGTLGGAPILSNVPLDGLPNAGGDLTGNPGFRGSTFSIMLPLVPDASGRYAQASFLSAGGILGVTPGTYIAGSSSQINTVTIDDAGHESLASHATGPLTQPRWYGSGVLLPTGEVMTFSGANRDEVLVPGTGTPVLEPEIWNPATGTWRRMATQGRARTYHNTAMLLPDGRVLVGGHAPIPTGYAYNVNLPGQSPQEGRDPSFEIYSPPYLFSGDRPTVTVAPAEIATGSIFTVTLGSAAEAAAVADGGNVLLMRNTTITHLVNADQRSVQLRVLGRDGATLTLVAPPDRAVTPAGPYLLFANRPGEDGLVPSVGKQVFVDAPVPAAIASSPTGGTDAIGSPPVVLRDPIAVTMENLAKAFGMDPSTFGAAASGRASRFDSIVPITPARPSGTGADAPGWLVLIAAGLPFAVLTGAVWLRRRAAWGRPAHIG